MAKIEKYIKSNKRNLIYFMGFFILVFFVSVIAFSFVMDKDGVNDGAQAYKINVTEQQGFNIVELDEDQFKIESNVPFQCADTICQNQTYCPTPGNVMNVTDLEGPTKTDLMVLGIGMSATNMEQNIEITHNSMGYLNQNTTAVDCGTIDFMVTDSGDWNITAKGGDTPAFLRHSQGECDLISEDPIDTFIGTDAYGTLAIVEPIHLIDECSPTGRAQYEDPANPGTFIPYFQVVTSGVGCFQNESQLTVTSQTSDLNCQVDPQNANHVTCEVHDGITDPTIRVGYQVTPVDYWMRGKTFYYGHAIPYPGYEGAIPDVLYQNSFGGVQYTEMQFDNLCRTATVCGDGVVQNPNDAGQNEECDDGNLDDGDGCDSDCTLPVCNEVCVSQFGCSDSTECTNGLCRNSDCSDEADCVCAECGDGILDDGEDCDDGNIIDGDGCDADCTLPVCQEVCTEALGCTDGMTCVNSTCVNQDCPDEQDCVCGTCGDGVLDEGEICDDGNMDDGDGCDADCTLPVCQEVCTEEYGCGDGMECTDGTCVNPECPEEDDCSCELCGDGIVQAPETWDEPWGLDDTPATGYGRMTVDIFDCCDTQQGTLVLTGPAPRTETTELTFRETEWVYLQEGTYSYVATPADPSCGEPMEGTFSVDECQEVPLNVECEQEGEPQINKLVNGTTRVTLRAGDQATYTLNYSNPTNYTLTNVVIQDPFDNQNQQYIKYVSQSSNPNLQFDQASMTWTVGDLAPDASGSIDIVIEILRDDELPDRSLEILNDFSMTWDGGSLESNDVVIIIPYAAQTGAGTIAVVLSIVLGGGIAVIYILSKQGVINLFKK